MGTNGDEWTRQRAEDRIYENKQRLEELKKDEEGNAEEIKNIEEQLNRDYILGYGRD